MDKKPTPKSKVDISPRGVASVSGSVDGGIIFGDNAKVSVGGDMVGRDKIVNTSSGVDPAVLVELLKAFREIDRRIDSRPDDPDFGKDDIKATVNQIQEEVKKGEQASPKKVDVLLKTLGGMADDIFQVTAATLTNPALGIGKAIQLIAQKAKSGG